MFTDSITIGQDIAGTLQSLQDRIQLSENGTVEFVYLSKSPDQPDRNVITYLTHDDDPVFNDQILLERVPPNLDADGAADLLDSWIDQGLQPFGKMFNIIVPGGVITVLPVRQGQLPAVGDIGSYTKTNATVFGLNANGTTDTEDNGVGSPALGSINTRNPNQKGAAIPIALARKLFGPLRNTRGHSIEVTRDNGLKAVAPIVDFGPSVGQVNKGIALDLTYETHVTELQGNGLISVQYRFI